MNRAAIDATFKRHCNKKGLMTLEGFVQALAELKQTPYAFNLGDKVKGLTVEECHYDKTFGAIYSVREGSGSSFEIGEKELITLKGK